MPITVYCPVCRDRYHLNDDMLGKRMRCKNALCREVFEVREADEAAATPATSSPAPATPQPSSPAPAKGYVAGCIGDMVPFVSAEAAEESPPATPAAPQVSQPTSASVGDIVPLLSAESADTKVASPTDAPSWQQAPPPVRRPSSPPAPAKEVPVPPPAPTAAPSWTQAPPPVRRPAPLTEQTPSAPLTPSTPAETPVSQQAPPPVPRSTPPVEPTPSAPPPAPPPAETPAWQQAPPPVRRPASPPAPAAASGPSPAVADAKLETPPKARLTQQRRNATASTVRSPAKPSSEPAPAPANSEEPPLVNRGAASNNDLETTKEDAPRELAPGTWEAPPVRRTVSADGAAPPAAKDETARAPAERSQPMPTPATGRFGLYFMVVCLLVIGAAVLFIVLRPGEPPEEEKLRNQALAALEQQDYRAAAGEYGKLAKSFRDSEHLKEYEFYRDLSLLLADAGGVIVDADRVIEELRRFLKDKVGSSRVDLQACKLEYSIVSPK